MQNSKNSLRLKVDGKQYEWHKQHVTGAEIRELGSISADAEIFIVIKGKDELIKNDESIDLSRSGLEHFISKIPISIIIVNGREQIWKEEEISYGQVVKLAYPDYVDNGTVMYTVTYTHGPKQNPNGTMVKGDKVYVKHKMIFNVTSTSRS